MTLKESDKRQARSPRFEDEEEQFYPKFERQIRPETKYVFHVNGRPRPPAHIHATGVRLWDIISTEDGPHKVIEVYWSGSEKRGWRADVLLKPVDSDAAFEKARKGGLAHDVGPKKFRHK